MTDMDAAASIIRIERTEEGRWDITVLTESGVAVGHGEYLFEAEQDDDRDEVEAVRSFAVEHGFVLEDGAMHEDGPDAFWARIVPAADRGMDRVGD
jgi:hypothetical protein